MTPLKVFKIGSVRLEPKLADITLLDVDAVVQPGGTSRAGESPQTSPWVIKADVDGSIARALQRHVPLQIGQVIVTPAGNLAAKYLLHAVVMDWALQHPSQQIVNDEVVASVVQKCLGIARALGVKSIAFTPWGTRVSQVEPAHITAIMLHAVANELQKPCGELEVVYLISNNPEHYQWFVDRAFIFGFLFNQLNQIQREIAALDVNSSHKNYLLSLLDNVRSNFVVYNEIIGGDKLAVGDIANAAGVAIGAASRVETSKGELGQDKAAG